LPQEYGPGPIELDHFIFFYYMYHVEATTSK
jgi:hypothetical protein